MHSGADLSSFYLGNEDIATEIQRLITAGHLASLLKLLETNRVSLRIEAVREKQGLREYLGRLPAPPPPPNKPKGPRNLPLLAPGGGDALFDGTPRPSKIWDPGASLCTRSRFSIVRPGGPVEEVYMPDHICPDCLNDFENVIDDCQRVCSVCDFRW